MDGHVAKVAAQDYSAIRQVATVRQSVDQLSLRVVKGLDHVTGCVCFNQYRVVTVDNISVKMRT